MCSPLLPSPPLSFSLALFLDLITRQRTRRCIQLDADAATFIIKHFNLRSMSANMDHARSNKLANKVNKAEAKHMNLNPRQSASLAVQCGCILFTLLWTA